MANKAHAISRELMGKIADEVFGGAIEDCSVIEEIYAAIKRHEADDTPITTVNMTGHLRAAGIGRDPENDRVVFLSLNRVPTDDELRAIHGAISRTPATCPFCTKPTYVLPCSHCGEPDVPEDRF